VGVTVARDLALHFRDFDIVRRASCEELEEVDGIGPKMSEAITSFFADARNAAAIDAVLERGVRPAAPTEERAGSTLAGKKFVFTGGLGGLSRSAAKNLIEVAGARVVGSVSKETDFVVAGSEAGSKLSKAEGLGLTVLDEEAFIRLLSEAGIELPDPPEG